MPKTITGTNDRVLEVNLTTRQIRLLTVPTRQRRLYLGGKGLGLLYLHQRLHPGTDPLSPDNWLVFTTGVLMGSGAPCSSRFAAVTKSPLTGIILSCSCGGPFGLALKTAGYDGLIIGGCSEGPVCLHINETGADFRDAGHLWGLDTVEAQQRLELGTKDGALVIGPAGENRVPFANVASGHRFLGRGGMGAVMGAKNLKAVAVRGGAVRIAPHDPERFERTRRRARRLIDANAITGHAYRRYGTAANVNPCRAAGLLPARNFREFPGPEAAAVSGESMRQKYASRPSACRTCTILCGHKGTFGDGSTRQIPEYETVGMLGPNLGILDTDRISEWNDLCGRLGIDTITTGATLAWAMEAGEKGLFETGLRFGSPEGIGEAIAATAHRRGIGKDLCLGTRRLSAKYGGAGFAMHVKGLETAAYDPRGAWGQGLGYAVANRGGCHLSAAVFAQEVLLALLRPDSTRAKARFVYYFENLYAAVNSLITCQFTSFAYLLEEPAVKYTPPPLLRMTMQYLPGLAQQLIFIPVLTGFFTAITGLELSRKDLLRAGERIHMLERWMNTREGIRRRDDTLPRRFLDESRAGDPKGQAVALASMLDDYYRLRGYDANGVPGARTLEKLGLEVQKAPASGAGVRA